MKMSRVVSLVAFAILGCLLMRAIGVESPDDSLSLKTQAVDSMKVATDVAAVDAVDLADVESGWKERIFRKGWSVNDTTIAYPQFVDLVF